MYVMSFSCTFHSAKTVGVSVLQNVIVGSTKIKINLEFSRKTNSSKEIRVRGTKKINIRNK